MDSSSPFPDQLPAEGMIIRLPHRLFRGFGWGLLVPLAAAGLLVAALGSERVGMHVPDRGSDLLLRGFAAALGLMMAGFAAVFLTHDVHLLLQPQELARVEKHAFRRRIHRQPFDARGLITVEFRRRQGWRVSYVRPGGSLRLNDFASASRARAWGEGVARMLGLQFVDAEPAT